VARDVEGGSAVSRLLEDEEQHVHAGRCEQPDRGGAHVCDQAPEGVFLLLVERVRPDDAFLPRRARAARLARLPAACWRAPHAGA